MPGETAAEADGSEPQPAAAMPAWRIYHGDGRVRSDAEVAALSQPPPRWRSFGFDVPDESRWAPHPMSKWPARAKAFQLKLGTYNETNLPTPAAPPQDSALARLGSSYRVAHDKVLVAVNAALQLRRPLLVTGDPGTGKTMLAYSIAHELQLGPVLRWNITSKTTLQDGLYQYDILDRVNDTALADKRGEPAAKDDIGEYLTLGPLGDALLPRARPRLLLIDELDKSDIDLPNDLLHALETGYFDIKELSRTPDGSGPQWVMSSDGSGRVPVFGSRVHCAAFPVVVMTSNREREFSQPFQRRCIKVNLDPLNDLELKAVAEGYFDDGVPELEKLVGEFSDARDKENRVLAIDQLLNLLYLRTRDDALTGTDREILIGTVLQSLDPGV